jgi:hypothetical protein
MDEIGLLLDPAFSRLVDLTHHTDFMQNHVGHSMTVKRPAFVFLEELNLIGMNDRIIDAIWVHESSQVAQVDPSANPDERITIGTGTTDFEYADHVPVLANFDAMLQGFDEDWIILRQPLDEGNGDASTIV